MPPEGRAHATIHATCCVVGAHGILFRGPAGSGKSSAARRLVAEHERGGGFARIVADDRVELSAVSGRLLARSHPAIVGLLEVRGVGIVRERWEPACIVRLVVDLRAEPGPRMPEGEESRVRLLDVDLPRLQVAIHDAIDLVSWQLRGSHDTFMTES